MAVTVTHPFVSAISDGADATVVRPSNWNATHSISGTLDVANGGTNIASYAIGDLIYASTTGVLSKLADVATGNALISGGVGVAPSYGKIGLTTHVSGTLPIANGGTNSTATATAGGAGYGTGTAHAYTAAGTSGQVLTSAGASAPTWTTPTTGTVTSVTGTAPVVSSGGATPAISMAAATTTVSGYLTSTDWNTFNGKQAAGTYVTAVSVASANGLAGTSSGGATPALTLSTSITGLLKGNGTAISAATAGTDYLTPTTGVTTFSGSSTGLTPSTATSGAITLAGTLAVANGGTNITTYAIGDLIYASTVGVLSKLADVATGNSLISGGVGVAPSYGKVGLTTHVSGTLPVANGGTNITSYTIGDIVYASTAGILSRLADVATGSAIISGGVGVAPSYGKVGLTTHISGVLPVANGGTGLSSGTSGGVLAFTATGTIASSTALAASALVIGGGAGVAPSTTTTATGALTFLGTPSSANLAALLTDETGTGVNVFATSPTFTTSINSGVTFTAFAGATTSLTIGGTGATSVFAVPGTLEQSSTTGAMTVAGGVYIAKKLTAIGGISGGTF